MYDIQYDEWHLVRFDQSLLASLMGQRKTTTTTTTSTNPRTYARIFSQFGHSYKEKTFYSRAGHAMVFHPIERRLYIIGGHRFRSYFRDVLVYNVDEDRLKPLKLFEENDVGFFLNFPSEYFQTGSTIRANIDPNTDEIFIFTVKKIDLPYNLI